MAIGTQTEPTRLELASAAYKKALAHEIQARLDWQVMEINKRSVRERGAAFTAYMDASHATNAALRELVVALGTEWVN